MATNLPDLRAKIGREVRAIRLSLKLTQVEASRRAKISARTWSRLERGRKQNYTLETLTAVADALQLQGSCEDPIPPSF